LRQKNKRYENFGRSPGDNLIMIWLAVILFPLFVAGLLSLRPVRGLAVNWMAPAAALPALMMAAAADAGSASSVPWLGLGAHFGFGDGGQVFLFFTALLWVTSGVYARFYMAADPRRIRFTFFFLLCTSSNLGLTVAQDVPTFYAFFTVLALSAYVLVIHDGSAAAQRAGLVYLAMTVLGEAMLLSGLLLVVSESQSVIFSEVRVALAQSPRRDLIIFLLLTGFGVKAGLLPLHFWLPLAHPVAPVPASAVLSGVMIKAGLLGWVRVMPVGEGSFPFWSGACIGAGLAAAFYGVIVGLFQNEAKTNLAYSSISQMGIMTVAVGVGFLDTKAWAPALAVLLVYAMNHAMAKGALFLGVGIAANIEPVRWKQRLVLFGMALPALAITGAPWTGGAIAKEALKNTADIAPSFWHPWMNFLVPLASVGTAMLLTRCLYLTWRTMQDPKLERHGPVAGLAGIWLVLLFGVGTFATFGIGYYGLEIERGRQDLPSLWSASWPLLLGLGLVLVSHRFLKNKPLRLRLPAGDVVVLIEAALRRMKFVWDELSAPPLSSWHVTWVDLFERVAALEERWRILHRGEARLALWEIGGLNLTLIVLALLVLLVAGNLL
jgi:formate hydrogenlyase subunit 3/multisubunit Na+/H+ antiporter MnhD subunit